MYTTINGIYENGKVILQESAPTEKSMRVLVVFVEENDHVGADRKLTRGFSGAAYYTASD